MENVASPPQKQLQVLCDVSTSNIDPLYGIADRKTLENRRTVAHSISAIKNNTRCFSSGVETQDTLLLEENLRSTELFKEDIGRLYSITERVEGWLSKQDWVFLG